MSLAARQAHFLARLAQEGPASAGLQVYRVAAQAHRLAALRAAFPVCERLVGCAFFAECARRYQEAWPSAAGDLNAYGAGLPSFLDTYPHAASLPYLGDVARLEWAVHAAGFAADPTPLDLRTLAALSPEAWPRTRFVVQPGTALVESPYPVVSIREANLPPGDGAFEGRWEGEAALVAREDLEVRVHRAGRDAPMLRRLLAAQPLESACLDEADAAALPRWVGAGLFAGIAP